MFDWNTYREELKGRIGEIAKLSPDTVRGYATLSGAGAKREEIAEAPGVAAALNADAALVFSARVMDAVDAHPGPP